MPLITDAATMFAWIYLLKNKSDLSIFKQFITMVELQFDLKIKSSKLTGGEFRSFTKYLTDLDIIPRLICSYTHHQNGGVEWKHRFIVDLGLTLLSHASFPLKFWDHALLTAVYLINRLLSTSLNHTSSFLESVWLCLFSFA
jgi:histone deacetylase 1/2